MSDDTEWVRPAYGFNQWAWGEMNDWLTTENQHLHADLAAERAEVERLRQTVRDRDGWNEHLVAEVSHLLLAVPRPFRMIVHRRAVRIAIQEARRER